jgi:hypothetical protein
MIDRPREFRMHGGSGPRGATEEWVEKPCAQVRRDTIHFYVFSS